MNKSQILLLKAEELTWKKKATITMVFPILQFTINGLLQINDIFFYNYKLINYLELKTCYTYDIYFLLFKIVYMSYPK
jgi:hypothetical protein